MLDGVDEFVFLTHGWTPCVELDSNETIARLAHRMMRITLRFPPTILPQFTRRAMSCCWTFFHGRQ